MTVKVLIPTALRPYAGQQSEIEANGSTVGEAMNDLATRFPDLKRHLYTKDGSLRNFVNVYLGDEDVRYIKGLATAIREGDALSIVPAIAGG